MVEIVYFNIEAEHVAQRLDNFLLSKLKSCPKSRVYRAIRSGEVRINGRRARPMAKLVLGDRVRVPMLVEAKPAEKGSQPLPDWFEHAVLYEDDVIMVLNKPKGLPVHAGHHAKRGIIERLRDAMPDVESLTLVHRLDKQTSGVLVLSKSRVVTVSLADQFRKRTTTKVYQALVWGHVMPSETMLTHRMQPCMRHGQRCMKCVDEGDGKLAKTHCQVMGLYGITGQSSGVVVSLLTLRPHTGRKHQLRSQLSHVGHPIVCDDLYGRIHAQSDSLLPGLSFCLHAASLTFFHPVRGEIITIEAPLPKEFKACLTQLDPMT